MSQHDDLFQELSRTLDVSPSPDFADGVRSRIARRRLIMLTTMSGLAIAASVLLVAVIRAPEPLTMAEPSRMAEAVSQVPTEPAATPGQVTPAVLRETRVAASRTPVAGQPPVESDRLLVVTNQMAVLQAAWAGHQVTAVETDAPPVEAVMTPEPAPIVVEPVRILPVVIADQRTPIERLPIIRRAVAALEMK